MTCEEARSTLHAYVDGELPPGESIALEAHLLDCRACAAEYQALRTVVDTVRGARPLYQTPAAGRSGVERLLHARYRRRRLLNWVSGAAAGLILIAGAILLNQARRSAPFDHFVSSATDAHLRYARGALHLDVLSEDGPEVSAWLGERLPFQPNLPKYPAQPPAWRPYTLVGARVLPFLDHSLGFVAYQLRGKPISLLIAPASLVTPSGGQVYQSGSLVFHFLSRDGLQLIAWTDRGLSYALVSDVQVSGAGSCVVCHGAEAERPKFERLVPAPGGSPSPRL